MTHYLLHIRETFADHPIIGYTASACSIFLGVAPQWITDAQAWLGLASVMVGIAVAILTLMIQIRTWREKPKERKRLITLDDD